MACNPKEVESQIFEDDESDYSEDSERVPVLEDYLECLRHPDEDKIDWEQVPLPKKANILSLVLYNIKSFINTDFRVIVDDEEFQCHLLVLHCYSEFFYQCDGTVTQVQLDSEKCSATTFPFVYEWMINESPFEEFSREDLLKVVIAARYLKIKQLEEQCWSLIDNQEIFNEETAFNLYIEAKQKDIPEICDIMLPRIQKFFLVLVSTKEWLELDCSDVQAFLASNLINVNNEMEVFMSAVRWLKHDWKNREKLLIDILDLIRFGNMPGWQLVTIRRNPTNVEFFEITKDPRVSKLIEDGMVNATLKNFHEGDISSYDQCAHSMGIVPVRDRNWSGTEKNYYSYREFLISLDQLYKKYSLIQNIPFYDP